MTRANFLQSARAAAIVVASSLVLSSAGCRAAEPHRAVVSSGDALIESWIESVGGEDAYRKMTSASFTLTTVWYDTLTAREQRRRPRYVWIRKGPFGEASRIERWESSGFITQAFDGRVAWATLDGQLLPETAKDRREVIRVARDVFYWFGLPFKLRDAGVTLDYHGRVAPPGSGIDRPLHHEVRVTFEEGVGEHQDVYTYLFLPGEHTPSTVTYVEQGDRYRNIVRWGRTERLGAMGYPIVPRRDWVTKSGKRTKAILVSDVVLNPDVPMTRFQPPNDVSP